MSELIDFGASAVTGGALGVIGTAIGRVAGFFERRQDLARVSSAYADLDATFAQGMMTVPVHSGARDYWDATAHP